MKLVVLGIVSTELETNIFCHTFILDRSARLAFSDFRVVGPFVAVCRKTIERLQCGTLTPPSAHAKVRVPHSQGMVFFLHCRSVLLKNNFLMGVSRSLFVFDDVRSSLQDIHWNV